MTLFNQIESPSYSAYCNIASGLNVFNRIVKESSEFAKLLEIDPVEVYQRAIELLDKPIDKQYENPDDTAIAVYTMQLQQCNPDLATSLKKSLTHDKNLFWAVKVNENF